MDLNSRINNILNQSFSTTKQDNGVNRSSRYIPRKKEDQESLLLRKIGTINTIENSDKNLSNMFNGCISPSLSIRKFIESNPKSYNKTLNNFTNNGNKLQFNSSNVNSQNSKNSYYILQTETVEDRLNTEVINRKQQEKHHSVKINKVMKTIEDLYKTLKLNKETTPVYRSNRPVFQANMSTLKFDIQNYHISSPVKVKKNQMLSPFVKMEKSKSKEKLGLCEQFEKRKKMDSLTLFMRGIFVFKEEFENESKRKELKRSFLK